MFPSMADNKFRERGKEILRIEALSDAVFAFSVSLLVAALEVPQTFDELRSIAKGAIPFFATVAMLFMFWYRQYLFFRRYGLNDFTTILLNLVYLAVIVFYIYPLKFLFSLLISSWSGMNLFTEAQEKGLVVLSSEDSPQLVILFSIGYALVWLTIYLMHRHVLKLAQNFEFTRYELAFTKMEARGALWNMLIGLFSLFFAWLGLEAIAGIFYLLIPFAMTFNYYLLKNSVKQMKVVKREKKPAVT